MTPFSFHVAMFIVHRQGGDPQRLGWVSDKWGGYWQAPIDGIPYTFRTC